MTDYTPEYVRSLEKEREKLREALREAESESKAKELFLSNMSHDIRTPMNAIIGMTALAKNHIDEKERVLDALQKIEVAGGHLLSLINDVLDMSRINSGRMKIREDRFELSDLLHELLVIVRPQSDEKGHSFRFETGEIYRETLYGDALRLRQIYVNIINNAVKYTKSGGKIRVSFSEELDQDRVLLYFSCADNGIGMSPEFVKRIFEPFERVNSSTVSGIEGTGLGMSIVKRLVEQMNGTITVESAENAGTTVKICIPLRYIDTALAKDALSGRNFLIIENDEQVIRRYREILNEAGCAFHVVGSSAEAVSALAEGEFRGGRTDAVIIGSVLQASETLYDIAAYMKKSNPGLPVILISEDPWDRISYQAERAGVDRFIPLPFFRKSLLLGLSDVLDGSGKKEEHLAVPDLSGKKLLLVEDNMINREIAKEILSATGVQIDSAENGVEAVKRFADSDPEEYSMILMDIQMPVMDGLTAARQIRQLERPDAASVPIYAMTANAFQEDVEKARASGMNGHLAKPIDINALMQVLRQIR